MGAFSRSKGARGERMWRDVCRAEGYDAERGGQGETKGYTKSGEEEAKGGEEMTQEEVVQAALTVERWCREQRRRKENCNCPFNDLGACKFFPCYPDTWDFERYLRNRGKKYEADEEFMREVLTDKGAET